MLKTRIITALVLLVVLLPALFWLPSLPFALLALLIACVAAWEFGRLAGQDAAGQRKFAGVILMACAGIGSQLPATIGFGDAGAGEAVILDVAFGLAALFWCVVCPLWLRRRWRLPARGWQPWLVGWIVIVPTWLAMVSLRQHGAWVLIGAMAIAWVADISAYFAGRQFGTTKLAPEISPGKTVAGAWGAVIGVCLYAVVAAMALGGLPQPSAWAWLAVGAVALTVASIWGDLLESLLKRQAGLKDSSQLLPGHGGVMDRIDSLTAVLPLSAWILIFL